MDSVYRTLDIDPQNTQYMYSFDIDNATSHKKFWLVQYMYMEIDYISTQIIKNQVMKFSVLM